MRVTLLVLAALVLAAGLLPSMRVAGLPYHDGVAAPESPPRDHVPLREVVGACRACEAVGHGGPLWAARLWYPFALAPLWALALALGGGAASVGRRRAAGWLLTIATCGLIALEGAYLSIDYEPFAAPPFGEAEPALAFVLVLFVLLARRPRDRRIDAVEGHVGAQAALSFLHLVTLPGTYARRWLEGGAEARTIGMRLLDAFPAPFLVTLAALVAIVSVVLLGTRAEHLGTPIDVRAGTGRGSDRPHRRRR